MNIMNKQKLCIQKTSWHVAFCCLVLTTFLDMKNFVFRGKRFVMLFI